MCVCCVQSFLFMALVFNIKVLMCVCVLFKVFSWLLCSPLPPFRVGVENGATGVMRSSCCCLFAFNANNVLCVFLCLKPTSSSQIFIVLSILLLCVLRFGWFCGYSSSYMLILLYVKRDPGIMLCLYVESLSPMCSPRRPPWVEEPCGATGRRRSIYSTSVVRSALSGEKTQQEQGLIYLDSHVRW